MGAIYWSKDGRTVHSSPRHHIEAYDDQDHRITLSLRIININPTDYGDYRCVAENSLGRDEQLVTLYGNTLPLA